MRNGKCLIVGAGIAGTTLAYWLQRYGFEPTLVERAPALRSEGYVIDFWGAGYEVADRMDVLPMLKELSLPINEIRLVDTRGRRCGGFGGEVLRDLAGGRFLSLLRGDLARVLYQSLHGQVRTIFGDTVTEVQQDGAGVWVEFRHAPAEQFDLVIGAGGLHSRMRNLVFGPDQRFEEFLGYYVASFAADGYPHTDPNAYVSYAAPGRQVTRYSLPDGRTIFLLVAAVEEKLDIGTHDRQSQKDWLHLQFADAGWECKDILKRLDRTDDLYFDSVSQIHMQAWSRQRTALVGDSCGCPSLLAGQGSALAMAGAYVLAGELMQAHGDYRTAFARYEDQVHPAVARKQQGAKKFARSFVPRSRLGILFRNEASRLMRWRPIARLAMKQPLMETLQLPDYRRH